MPAMPAPQITTSAVLSAMRETIASRASLAHARGLV
jgi:hypothetical protein